MQIDLLIIVHKNVINSAGTWGEKFQIDASTQNGFSTNFEATGQQTPRLQVNNIPNHNKNMFMHIYVEKH